MVEELTLVDDSESKFDDLSLDIKRVLGLIHENMSIDNPVYDKYDNLIEGRLRIYSDSASVGTDNNVIGTYSINCNSTKKGTFNSWQQTRIS